MGISYNIFSCHVRIANPSMDIILDDLLHSKGIQDVQRQNIVYVQINAEANSKIDIAYKRIRI